MMTNIEEIERIIDDYPFITSDGIVLTPEDSLELLIDVMRECSEATDYPDRGIADVDEFCERVSILFPIIEFNEATDIGRIREIYFANIKFGIDGLPILVHQEDFEMPW